MPLGYIHVLTGRTFYDNASGRSVIHMTGAIFEHHSIKEGTVGCVLLEDQSFTCMVPSLKTVVVRKTQ
jgi:hypothetical protein